MGPAENEISRWEARTAAGGRRLDAVVALLDCHRLSRYLPHNSAREPELSGRAPTAAGTGPAQAPAPPP